MAVKWIEEVGGGLLGFWEITEAVGQLMEELQPGSDDLAHFSTIKNERRRKEWLTVRLLLRTMTSDEERLVYDPTGKPRLTFSNWHISISHSANRVAILLHPLKFPGIDIELITRDIITPSRKFLSSSEWQDCLIEGSLSNQDILLRWCAKEAVFKMVPFTDIDFASQIAVEAPPITAGKGNFVAHFIAPGEHLGIPLSYRIIDEMLMVWGFLAYR